MVAGAAPDPGPVERGLRPDQLLPVDEAALAAAPAVALPPGSDALLLLDHVGGDLVAEQVEVAVGPQHAEDRGEELGQPLVGDGGEPVGGQAGRRSARAVQLERLVRRIGDDQVDRGVGETAQQLEGVGDHHAPRGPPGEDGVERGPRFLRAGHGRGRREGGRDPDRAGLGEGGGAPGLASARGRRYLQALPRRRRRERQRRLRRCIARLVHGAHRTSRVRHRGRPRRRLHRPAPRGPCSPYADPAACEQGRDGGARPTAAGRRPSRCRRARPALRRR
jgi:hypothetical protein